MPFQFLVSPSGQPIAAARAHFEPVQHPTANANLANRTGQLSLHTLPDCMLRQVVQRLGGGAMVALSRTSKRMHVQLDRDFVAPIRLAERLTWVVSNSGFQRALREIAQLPPALRRSLLHQMPLDQLHPAMFDRAFAARLALLPAASTAPWPGEPGAVPTLPPVPCAGAQNDGKRTTSLDDIAQRPVLDIAQALDADARVPTLTDLANRVCRNQQRWCDLLEGLLATVHRLRRAADGQSVPARAQLLTAVATALADSSRYVVLAACRSPLWHRAFDEARALPPALRQPIWLELAKSAAYDFDAALEQAMPAEAGESCWYRMIEAVRDHMPVAQASEALLAMLESVDGLDDVTSNPAPYIALLQAASRLPDTQAVPVIKRVVEQAYRMGSAENYEPIWQAVFEASRELETALQQQVLVVLGQRLPDCDGRLDRWFALSDRVAALPLALRREPLLAMIDAELTVDVPARLAVPRMMAFVRELDHADRAALLSALIQVYDDDPRHWPDMVNAAVDLPLRMRSGPFTAIAHRLLVVRKPLPGGRAPQGSSDTAPAAPGDVSLCTWPTSEDEARRQFTELLGMLTWADRGFVMLAIAPYASVQRLPWLIDEGLRLPPSGRYEVRLFTKLAERATRPLEPEDAQRILPALATAVRALPPDQCASALYWLRDACLRADMPHVFAPTWAHFSALLPAEDARLQLADGNRLKRKAPERPDHT